MKEKHIQHQKQFSFNTPLTFLIFPSSKNSFLTPPETFCPNCKEIEKLPSNKKQVQQAKIKTKKAKTNETETLSRLKNFKILPNDRNHFTSSKTHK